MSVNLLSDGLTILPPSGGGVFRGGGGWGSAGFLDSFQAAIFYSDCVTVQAAETGENVWYWQH